MATTTDFVATTVRATLIDYDALHVGGMPAFEAALRRLEAEVLTLQAALGMHLAVEAQRTHYGARARINYRDCRLKRLGTYTWQRGTDERGGGR